MTGNSKPKHFPNFTVYSTQYPLQVLSKTIAEPEPTTYTQAVTSPEWHAAMGREFDALMMNGTWSLYPRPTSMHIVQNKWVFKIKCLSDGSIEHYKACLVAKRI